MILNRTWERLRKMIPEGDGGQGGSGGGGGSNGLLTPSGSGGGAAGAGAGEGTGAGASGGSGSAAATGEGGGSGGAGTPDWRSSLPKELQDSPSLKKFTSVEALAGAYTSAEKMIGMDKIVIPNQNSTEADWNNVFKKLGLPDDVKKYEVKFKDGNNLRDDFITAFKDSAFKSGILPTQAQKLADWFVDLNVKSELDAKNNFEGRQKTELQALQKEWGKAFDQNLSRAQQVVKTFADPDVVDYLNKSGMANDVRLIKLLSKVGIEHFKEDAIAGEGSSGSGALSPAAAKAEIAKIQGDMKGPYYQKGHPEHAIAVARVKDLFEMIHGKPDDGD